jgi:hypothetical protein
MEKKPMGVLRNFKKKGSYRVDISIKFAKVF